ncbi:hypothetical protein [Bradyrhizobium sp. LA6.12]|uniref:hypothetical protein n=1 Tax=unclassified Bradyrhizobium TaxID=2631580 RepID=UPI003395611E
MQLGKLDGIETNQPLSCKTNFNGPEPHQWVTAAKQNNGVPPDGTKTQSPAAANGRALKENDLVGTDRFELKASAPQSQDETALAAAFNAALARKAVRP